MSQTQFLRYLQTEKRYSPNTIISYKNDLKSFYDFLSLNVGIDEIIKAKEEHIRSWLVYLMKQKNAPSTINRKLSSLKSFYRFCVKEEMIKVNPTANLNTLKVPKRLPKQVEEKKMKFLLEEIEFENTFKGSRSRIIIEILYQTGMRSAELINLKIKEIDFGQNAIKVFGKRNKERIIPISKSLAENIGSYIKGRKEIVNNIIDPEFLILTNKGRKAYHKLIYETVRNYINKVSTQQKKSPHVLRHSFATHLLNNGAELNAVKELLGHSSLSSTQIYTHNSIKQLIEVHKQSHPKAKN